MAIKVIVYDDNKDRRESLKILINILLLQRSV